MRCLVTGSAGFIGSNLVRACVKADWEVVGIDNFATGRKDVVEAAAAAAAAAAVGDNYTFYELDINDTKALSSVLCNYHIDVVFHLAALPRVQFSTDQPVASNIANVDGTVSVLEAARKTGVKRVVYSASSSMYGGTDIPFPTPETVPAHPRSNYALQKYSGAEYCRLFSELYGMDTVSLVYFNVFGPGQYAGSAYATVISAFCEAAAKDMECRIDGTGEQSRDFCYIDNVVKANILAATHDSFLGGDRFNIACGETHSVNEVFGAVSACFKKSIPVVYAPVRLGDPIKSQADISKAQSVLGYEPTIKFEQGIKLTAKWWADSCPII